MSGDKAALAGLVQPPRLVPSRRVAVCEVVLGLPDAELLRAAEVRVRVAETESLQSHEATFREQPIGTLPIHRSALAALGLSGNGDFGDDPLRCLHPKWSRRIGVTRHVGPIAGMETGEAENL